MSLLSQESHSITNPTKYQSVVTVKLMLQKVTVAPTLETSAMPKEGGTLKPEGTLVHLSVFTVHPQAEGMHENDH